MSSQSLGHKPLHDKQTQVSDGDSIAVGQADSLIISISGTSTSFTIQFMASLNGNDYFLIDGDKTYGTTIASTTSIMGEGWQFDVSGYDFFKAKLTSISNGNITVMANAIKKW